jgi:hypothetical protein
MAGIEGAQRFPFINLEKALERAKQIYEGDPRGNEMAIPTAFACWGYSEKSSGGFQTVGALKAYGLLAATGANDSRKVKLTKEALNYFRDEREDVRHQLMARFATAPPLLNSLWRDWGAQVPSDTVARSQLKVDRGLAEQSARSLLGIYKDNLAFAGLTGDDKIPEPASEDEGDGGAKVQVGEYVRWSGASFDERDQPRRVTWISDDGKFVRVHGNPTGIPMSEVTATDPPKLDMTKPAFRAPSAKGADHATKQDITVLLTGGRLQITADVDADGIVKLKDVLAKYEDILKLIG